MNCLKAGPCGILQGPGHNKENILNDCTVSAPSQNVDTDNVFSLVFLQYLLMISVYYGYD